MVPDSESALYDARDAILAAESHSEHPPPPEMHREKLLISVLLFRDSDISTGTSILGI
ncbi:uncharacterized protein PADG_11238 [Paracoccidioides brasiliensis Pb18]|uniref:Uncharacterized protein n=2 Tax=Paracoccidioides brasiliensis TaxID=121759 RepID=A0A0A0HVM4_PARBD|nr:uncharacterized protein PADG_11238 [Paracoccidioides brasiliensis Pb18]KGM92423.1 hypothetical protein PADG_11238 [Paracoccidioides brasiliensis Pb18]ODH26003.1 hypothetical protein ACO22_04893 [Paracoccidioides brasiliensis]ODH47889.1 hypothetical protein GX48_06008 [Paracoccidioides brasiliensis]